MSLGYFAELRLKKQVLRERANRLREDEPEPDDIDMFGNFVCSKGKGALLAKEAYGTGVLGEENLVQPDDRTIPFGSLGTGVPADRYLQSTTQVTQTTFARMSQTINKDSEFQVRQKETNKFIKEQNKLDSIKE